jgi:hypothetical protein
MQQAFEGINGLRLCASQILRCIKKQRRTAEHEARFPPHSLWADSRGWTRGIAGGVVRLSGRWHHGGRVAGPRVSQWWI